MFCSYYLNRGNTDNGTIILRKIKGICMRKNTKIMSEEEEEKLFHCDEYGYECCQLRDKLFIIILLMGIAFMIGLNMQAVIEAVGK